MTKRRGRHLFAVLAILVCVSTAIVVTWNPERPETSRAPGKGRRADVAQPLREVESDSADTNPTRGPIVSGHVRSVRGDPLPGIRVEVVRGDRGMIPAPIWVMPERLVDGVGAMASAETASDGAYHVVLPEPGTYTLSVQDNAWLPETVPNLEVETDVNDLDFHLLRGAAVSGTVVDEDARPVAGVRVTAISSADLYLGTGQGTTVRTDRHGRFALRSGLNKHVLAVSHPDYALAVHKVAPPDRNITVRLVVGVRAVVQVQDEAGEPVSGANVFVRYGALLASGITDARGRLEWTRVHPGGQGAVGRDRGSVFVRSPHHAPQYLALLDLRPIDGRLDLGTVVLQRGATVRGVVLVKGSGEPFPGAFVWSVDEGFLGGRPQRTVISDHRGRFVLRGVNPFARGVVAFGPGHLPNLKTISTDPIDFFVEHEMETVHVIPETTVSGVVRAPDGTTVACARVRLTAPGELAMLGFEPRAISDANGRFLLRGVFPENTGPIVASRGLFADSEPVYAVPGAEPVTLTLRSAVLLEGRVVDPAKGPIEGVRIFVKGMDYVVTDRDGKFQVARVPLGERQIRARHRDYPAASVSITLRPSAAPVTVPDIVLRSGLEIAGRVIDAQGAPVSGVRVSARSQQGPAIVGSRRQSASARSDARGEFALRNLRDVEMRLLVRAKGMVPQARVLRPGGEPVVFRLARGVEVKGRITFRGRPLAGASVVARRDELSFMQVKTRRDGLFHLKELPADQPFTFECRHKLYETLRIADFRAPTEERDYEMSEGRVIAGVVVDENGAPVPNLSLVIHAVERPVADGKGQMKFIQTDNAGRFRVGGLAYDKYDVRVTRGNLNWIPDTLGRVRTGDEDARLTAVGGLEIHGVVRDLQGNGIDRVRVRAFRKRVSGDAFEVKAETRTRDNGMFWMHALKKGTYEFTVENPWRLTKSVSAEAGERDPVTLIVSKR